MVELSPSKHVGAEAHFGRLFCDGAYGDAQYYVKQRDYESLRRRFEKACARITELESAQGETNGERCKHGWWKNRCGECVAESTTPLTDAEAGAVFIRTGIPKLITEGAAIKPEHWFDYARAIAEYLRRGAVKTGCSGFDANGSEVDG